MPPSHDCMQHAHISLSDPSIIATIRAFVSRFFVLLAAAAAARWRFSRTHCCWVFSNGKDKKNECRRCGHCLLLVFPSLFDSACCCCCCCGCCLRDTCPPEFCQDRAKAAYWYLVVVTKTAVQPFPGGYRPQTDRQTLRHSLKLPGEWPPFFWDPCVQRPEIISNDKSDLNAFTDGSSFGKNYLKIIRTSFGAHSQLQKKVKLS